MVAPFFSNEFHTPGVAARITGSGLLFLGVFESQYNFTYGPSVGSATTTENLTSFIADDLGNITPDKWHAETKLGALKLTQWGELSVGSTFLTPKRTPPSPPSLPQRTATSLRGN